PSYAGLLTHLPLTGSFHVRLPVVRPMKIITMTGALSSTRPHRTAPLPVSIFATIGPLPFRSFVASARLKLPSSGSPVFEGDPWLFCGGGVGVGALAVVVVVSLAGSFDAGSSSGGGALQAGSEEKRTLRAAKGVRIAERIAGISSISAPPKGCPP